MKHSSLDIEKIKSAIKKGADFILQQVNTDGGVKWDSETSVDSGIWVTAETVDFFLTTKTHAVDYSKVQPLIDFILQQQRQDGSWAILSKNTPNVACEASTISTGYCTYVLKLALGNGFFQNAYKQQILIALEKGEEWLRTYCIKKNGFCFWGAEKITDSTFVPNGDDETIRMDCIFDTFYAILGLTNPLNPTAILEKNKECIQNTRSFVKQQTEWFIDRYTRALHTNPNQDLSNVSSTFCRLVNMSDFLGGNIISAAYENQIKSIINKCTSYKFSTTRLLVYTHTSSENRTSYTNNTPFDMAIALMNLHTNFSALQEIVQKFLDNQENGGFWYLNFDRSCKTNTWTTIEILITLENYCRTYQILEKEERLNTIENKFKQLKTLCIISFVAIILMIILYLCKTSLGSVATYLYYAIGLVGSVCSCIPIYKYIVKNK